MSKVLAREQKILGLPKWAQMEIRRLEANVRLLEQAESITGGTSLIGFRRDPMSQRRIYLPDQETLEFFPDSERSIDVKIVQSTDMISVRTGEGRLVVLPKTSNMIQVYRERW